MSSLQFKLLTERRGLGVANPAARIKISNRTRVSKRKSRKRRHRGTPVKERSIPPVARRSQLRNLRPAPAGSTLANELLRGASDKASRLSLATGFSNQLAAAGSRTAARAAVSSSKRGSAPSAPKIKAPSSAPRGLPKRIKVRPKATPESFRAQIEREAQFKQAGILAADQARLQQHEERLKKEKMAQDQFMKQQLKELSKREKETEELRQKAFERVGSAQRDISTQRDRLLSRETGAAERQIKLQQAVDREIQDRREKIARLERKLAKAEERGDDKNAAKFEKQIDNHEKAIVAARKEKVEKMEAEDIRGVSQQENRIARLEAEHARGGSKIPTGKLSGTSQVPVDGVNLKPLTEPMMEVERGRSKARPPREKRERALTPLPIKERPSEEERQREAFQKIIEEKAENRVVPPAPVEEGDVDDLL